MSAERAPDLTAASVGSLDSAALNEFLRVYLDDAEAGRERPLAEYQALFPGHEARIAREVEGLREASRSGSGPPLVLGQTFGAYILLRPLGQGGQGRVWLARDGRLGRLVALKLLAELAALSPQALERFRREAAIASRLSDPGICTVFETGCEHGVPFIAMRYVDGEPLSALLARARAAGRPPLALAPEAGREELRQDKLARLARLVERLARSLHEAHEAGVVHRDVKPGNVILAADGLPVLVDFGLARAQDGEHVTLTQTGDALGTPAYMAPELLAEGGRGADRRADVYALGVVLYECLTLRRPFEAESLEGLRRAILADEPPDPRRALPDLPEDLRTILATAIEKDRARRYATAAALAEDLRRFRAGEPILARAPSQAYRLRKLVRKHRVLAASLLAILLVSLVATAVTVREWLRTQARASEVMRLAALQVLDDLVAEADGLWPPVPARIASYESWLGRAEELLSSRPQHEATLARLRARAVWVAGAEGDPRWAFSSSEDQWWHNQIEKLVAGLRTLADAENGLASSGVSPSHGWGVRRRLLFAREVEERSLTDAAAAERWREALDSIADPARCPLYRGLRLAPQLGLLPLGRDQGTGLWEFAHLQSGEPARRDAAGTLLIAEETGLVLVLVPGGDFWMGAQAIDPSGRNYDPLADEEEAGVHEVTLSPYLLAKHEMTQGQWQRATGRNPSRYGPHNYYGEWNRAGNTSGLWLHPVEQVSWLECVRVCGQLGLVLPSEAQWEYAARAGTSTPWWTGSERTSLAGAANLLDGYARTHGGEDWRDRVHDPWLDDGHTVHAPVASYAPNAFGLHDVLGNVWEWCLDRFDLDLSFYANGPRYDPVNDPTGARVVTRRGGSYYNSSTDSRGSGRGADPPENVSHSLGLRPARPLEGLAPAGR